MIAVAGYPPVPSSVPFAQQLPQKVSFWHPPCPLKPAQVYLGLQLIRLSFTRFLLACGLLVLYKGFSPILRVFLELFKSFLKAVVILFCKTQHLGGCWTQHRIRMLAKDLPAWRGVSGAEIFKPLLMQVPVCVHTVQHHMEKWISSQSQPECCLR